MATDADYLAAAGSFLNTAATITAADMGKKSRKAYYKYLRESEDRADERALRNWNMANEYNSPAAQMARYKEAGLNPALIYGQDNSSGAVGAVEPMNPGYNENDVGVNAFQALANGLGAYQQIIGNQIANTNAARVGRLTDEKIKAAEILNDVKARTADYQVELTKTDLNSKKFKILMDTNFEFMERKSKVENVLQDLENKKIKGARDREEIRQLRKSLDLLDAQIKYTNKQMDIMDEELRFKKETHDDRVLGVKFGNYQTQASTRFLGYQGDFKKNESDNYLYNKFFNGGLFSVPVMGLKLLYGLTRNIDPITGGKWFGK